jgi:uncharacterized protein YuzE
MKKDYVEVEVGKAAVRKISQLVEAGILTKDKHGNVCGIPAYIDALSELHEVYIHREFLESLKDLGLICIDNHGRVFGVEELIVHLVAGKSIAEIRRDRENNRRKCSE